MQRSSQLEGKSVNVRREYRGKILPRKKYKSLDDIADQANRLSTNHRSLSYGRKEAIQRIAARYGGNIRRTKAYKRDVFLSGKRSLQDPYGEMLNDKGPTTRQYSNWVYLGIVAG